MKKILLSMLALAALASCTKSVEKGEGAEGAPVLIALSAGVPAAAVTPGVKSPVNAGSSFTAGVAGWESSLGNAAYNTPQTWKSDAVVVAGPTAQSITLNPVQVYNPDRTISTYIKAWYPAGTLSSGVVTFTNADGSADAMLAGEVVGTKADKNNAKTLAFAHKTTQLKFEVKAGSGLAPNTTIERITVKGVELPGGFDLMTDAVSYGSPADLDVPGIVSGALTIGSLSAPAGDPVMIRPVTGNTLTLDVTTSTATYAGITATIDTDPNFVEGRAYTITLTFGQSGISLKATVADWTTGTGSGTVE